VIIDSSANDVVNFLKISQLIECLGSLIKQFDENHTNVFDFRCYIDYDVLCHTQVDEVLKDYIHRENTYKKIRDLMNDEMDKGLSRSGNADAAVKMFISYVQSLPDGSGNEL